MGNLGGRSERKGWIIAMSEKAPKIPTQTNGIRLMLNLNESEGLIQTRAVDVFLRPVAYMRPWASTVLAARIAAYAASFAFSASRRASCRQK